MKTEDVTIDLRAFVIAVCPKCGIEFAMPRAWVEDKWANKGAVYCPNGHTNKFKKDDKE